MPVTDLRNILTVPQDAPQNPGFNRTRQLMGMPTEPFQSALAFERAAPGIRANQGLAYLQEIQNHQNEIAQQAQNIRIQQEAQLAAEQATQGLSGIQPDNPQYLNQRQQILQQNPNALLNPQFRNALNVYDEGYQNVARQRALEAKQIQAQRQQANALGLRAIEFGDNPDEIAPLVESGNVAALAQRIGNARRASTGQRSGASAKSPELAALKDNFDLLANERNQFIKDGAEVPADIEKEYQDTKNLLVGYRKSLYMKPDANTLAATVTPPPTAKPEPAPISPEIRAVQNVDLSKIPYAQQEQYVKDLEAKAGETNAINQAWNDAQLELQSKLEKVIGTGNIGNTNYSKLRAFAQAVVNEDRVPLPYEEGDEIRAAPLVWKKALKDMGFDITKALPKAFTEPGNKRKTGPFGSQDVPYEQLFKSWAENYLKTSPVTIASQAPALPAKKASVLDSLLDSSIKPTQ